MAHAQRASSPRHKGLMPMAQPFFPQSYATPMIPYCDQQYQQYQQGILIPMMSPQHNNPMWCPPTHPNANYYPCYQQGQQGFGTLFQSDRYTASLYENSGYYEHSINGRPNSGVYMGHGRDQMKTSREPTYWQSPPSQHMTVPQNSPVIPMISLDGQSYLLPDPQELKSPDSLREPTQYKRNRGTSFPGANPPVLAFFEGSKKSDWGTYSCESGLNPQQINKQKTSTAKDDSQPSTSKTLNINNKHPRSPPISQDARNHLAPGMPFKQQTYLPQNQEVHINGNRPSNYNWRPPSSKNRAPIPAKFRKPYSARSSTNIAPIQNIQRVEMNRSSQFNNGKPKKLFRNEDLGDHRRSPSSVDPANLTPPSNSSIVKKSSSPPIATSVPAAARMALQLESSKPLEAQLASQRTIEDLRKYNFTFNPKATDFIFTKKSNVPKAEDEYVGFYITPEETYPRTPPENIGPIVYDCDPMSWQLPDILTSSNVESLKSCGDGECSCGSYQNSGTVKKFPKEFIGKTPGNMNWDNGVFTIIREVSSPRSWASWDSDDEAEVLERTIGTRFLSALDENKDNPEGVPEKSKTLIEVEIPKDIEVQKLIGCNAQKVYVGAEVSRNKSTESVDVQIFRDQSFTKPPKSQGSIETSEESAMSPTQSVTTFNRSQDRPPNPQTLNDFAQHIIEVDRQPKTGPEQENMKSDESQEKETTSAPTFAGFIAPKEIRNPKAPAPIPVVYPPRIQKPTINKTLSLPPLNYRDALLKKVAQETLVVSLKDSLPPKVPRIVSRKPATPKAPTKQIPSKAKAGPSAEVGGRRKFFLHPIPNTATYDSIIKQLKGGMLEDIYISGLSPHPSAWKGPKDTESYSQPGNQLNGKDTKSWYCHVSFYSEEGASKFWELVNSGKQSSGPYKSLYGGFDDQEPGFFIVDGTKVLVNWRHNDQRTVNPLVLKAVIEEGATRCLLLTFNVDATKNRWVNKENHKKSENSTKTTLIFNELSFINKVAVDIESWGQADSNLQGIHLLNNDNSENTDLTTKTSTTSEVTPKVVRVIVSFIKLLTAAKAKRHFSTLPDYCKDGYCDIKYYKDECSESIDAFKATRKTKDTAVNKISGAPMPAAAKSVPVGNSGYGSRRRRNASRAEKGSTFERNVTEKGTNTAEWRSSREQYYKKENIGMIGNGKEGSDKKGKGTILSEKAVECSLDGKSNIIDSKENVYGKSGGKISDGKGSHNWRRNTTWHKEKKSRTGKEDLSADEPL